MSWTPHPDPTYGNPNNLLPMPQPAAGVMPASIWTSDWQRFQWAEADGSPVTPQLFRANPPASYVYEYTWSSPVFDLRPELRSGTNTPKNGLPVWNKAGRLYVNVNGLTTPAEYAGFRRSPTSGLTASAQDYMNTVVYNQTSVPRSPSEFRGVNSVVPVGSPVNVTSGLVSVPVQQNMSTIFFAPPGTSLGGGESYPVRYWRVSVTFRYLVPVAEGFDPPTNENLPVLYVQSAVY